MRKAKYAIILRKLMIRRHSIHAPLLLPAICLTAGLVAQHAFDWQCPWAFVLMGIVVFLLLSWRWAMVQSVGIGLSCFVLGLWLMQRSEAAASVANSRQVESTAFDRLKIQALQWREGLLLRYKEVAENDEQYAVLAAMTLGDKSALTKELRETYSVAGASHILALSGLHLGIVYMLLTMLTLGRRRHWLSQILVVLGIWAFALLTGLSVSVVRSASMISLYALFSLGGRQRSSLNLLCFTAIVMLIANPSTLFDIGFQLSFLSVLAILLFMPLFDSFKPPVVERHLALRWLWGMIAVSLSAQLGVAPLIAYYFGRFSSYFLLTNFIVVPLATIILYGALLVIIVPAVGSVLAWVVQGLNSALNWLSQLPGASIDGLYPSVIQIVLIYALVLLFYVFLQLIRPRRYWP